MVELFTSFTSSWQFFGTYVLNVWLGAESHEAAKANRFDLKSLPPIPTCRIQFQCWKRRKGAALLDLQ